MWNKKLGLTMTLLILIVNIVDFYSPLMQFLQRMSIYQLDGIITRSVGMIFILFVGLALIVKKEKAVSFLMLGTFMGGLGNFIGLGLGLKTGFITSKGIILRMSFLVFYFSLLAAILINRNKVQIKKLFLINIAFIAGLIGAGIICFNKVNSSIFAGRIISVDSIYGVGIVILLIYFWVVYRKYINIAT